MFVPEYSITNKILTNISQIENAKGAIDQITLLPNWEQRIKKEAYIKSIQALLQLEGLYIEEIDIKKHVDNLKKITDRRVKGLLNSIEMAEELGKFPDIAEEDLKVLYNILKNTESEGYRSFNLEKGVNYQEILSEVVQLFDWLYSVDAQETHPVLVGSIFMARILEIKPFPDNNQKVAALAFRTVLKLRKNNLYTLTSVEGRYGGAGSGLDTAINTIFEENDYTNFIEYISENFSFESQNLKEKLKLLAKDTKVSKVSGNLRLSPRQHKIVGFLQDYGILQNKDYQKIFPNISEDTVLRELKDLMDKNLIVKRGKTKSSYYELK